MCCALCVGEGVAQMNREARGAVTVHTDARTQTRTQTDRQTLRHTGTQTHTLSRASLTISSSRLAWMWPSTSSNECSVVVMSSSARFMSSPSSPPPPPPRLLSAGIAPVLSAAAALSHTHRTARLSAATSSQSTERGDAVHGTPAHSRKWPCTTELRPRKGYAFELPGWQVSKV